MLPAPSSTPVIRDCDGNAVEQSIPLSTIAFASVERWAMYPRQIPESDPALQQRGKDHAWALIQRHHAAREADAKASSGNDLNNFWVLYESAPGWQGVSNSPRQEWELESGTGFSEKYLDEPLSVFAGNIREAYRVHGIDPDTLRDSIQAASSNVDYTAQAWKELRTIYIHMRDLGYADKELVQ